MGPWRHLKLIGAVAVTAGALLACTVSGITILPSPTPCSGWAVVPSPNVPSASTALLSVAALSPADAWAVGYSATASNVDQTLTEHWDGAQWQIQPSPNIGPHASLSAVAAVPQAAPATWWAVGDFLAPSPLSPSGVGQTLILQWTSGAGWTLVPSPNVAGMSNLLSAVSADAPTDAWAVGLAGSPGGGSAVQGLLEHWDGARWSLVPGPTGVSGPYALKGVVALTPTNAWAVGSWTQPSGSPLPLAAHWNGVSWTLLPTPPLPAGSVFGALNGVSAVPGTPQLWAVGLGGAHGTLTELWSGRGWTLVPSPGPSGLAALNGVIALSATNAWAVGDPGALASEGMSLIAHWARGLAGGVNGQWSLVAHPHPGASQETLKGTAWVPTTPAEVWAVGSFSTAATANTQTLIERYC
jgi:hypothetical protein